MSTPMDIPSQDLRSPAPKLIKYARTFQDVGLPSSKAIQPLKPGASLTRGFSEVHFSSFMKASDETMLFGPVKKDFFLYILAKQSMKHEDKFLFSFKQHLSAIGRYDIISEPSSVIYLSIVDMHGDTIEAMSKVSCMYIEHTGISSLIVAGDTKTYL